jgi:phosphatidate cytidylyltransferase
LGVLLPSSALLSTVSSGLIFFFLPISLVVCNDSFAYITGFAIGRTPLIALSPKKTVEGFIGGFVATLIWGLILPLLLAPYLTSMFTSVDIRSIILCPVPVEEWWSLSTSKCNIDALAHGIYVWKPLAQSAIGAYLPALLKEVQYCDLQVHAMVMGVFASLVAPFGGFFASGLKRALKIKDFGTSIPGHGGFTDRMDCQLVMGFFAYIYLHYVIGIYASAAPFLFRKAVFMSDGDISALQRMLTCFLGTEGHSANPYDTFLQCRDMNMEDSIPT